MTRRVSKRAARLARAAAPKARELALQQADFTAEGAPPPGKVGLSIPETPDAAGNKEQEPQAPAGTTAR